MTSYWTLKWSLSIYSHIRLEYSKYFNQIWCQGISIFCPNVKFSVIICDEWQTGCIKTCITSWKYQKWVSYIFTAVKHVWVKLAEINEINVLPSTFSVSVRVLWITKQKFLYLLTNSALNNGPSNTTKDYKYF